MTSDTNSILVSSDWAPRVRELIEELIRARGSSSPDYDPGAPPYAVFDCDNTTVFRDVQDVTLTRMLRRRAFALSSEALSDVLARGLADLTTKSRPTNVHGEPFSLLDLLADAMDSLAVLERGEDEAHQLAFEAKFRALYHAIGEHVSDAFACSWITRIYAGSTPREVMALARAAYADAAARDVCRATQRSPEALPGRTGVVEVTWGQGLRPISPMRELYGALRGAGFEVWVCSASHDALVRAAVCGHTLGYGVPASRVLGMRLETDSSGVFLSTRPEGVEDTHGDGKVVAIERHIVAHLGYGPALVAGDSSGDAPMLEAFDDTAVRLVINRHRDGHIGEVSARAGDEASGVVLQGRDERTGGFRPHEESVLVG